MSEVQKFFEVEYLKSLSYEEINDHFRALNNKYREAMKRIEAHEGDLEADAVKAWNTRAQPKQPSDEEILELAGCPWQVNDNEDFIAVVRAVLDKWGR